VSQRTHEHEPSEAELVRRSQRGDAAAFAALATRYQDRVFNLCYRMCHNEADALDMAQTTFLRALQNMGRFGGRACFYTWLFRIAVNVVLTRRRSRSRQVTASLNGAGHDMPQAVALPDRREPDGAAACEQRELQERVAWALAQLDQEFRAAVVLKDIEDMDYAAIAEVLNVPVGTVKSRIHRGRLMLRDLLRAERVNVAGT
jgi:RNA polymerase sigma-70 factor (ECF subfamily)